MYVRITSQYLRKDWLWTLDEVLQAALLRGFDEQPMNRRRAILVREKPGWGSGEEKESNAIPEEQADERCMGNMTRSKIVGVCQEAAMTACCERPWMTTGFIVVYSDVPMDLCTSKLLINYTIRTHLIFYVFIKF